MKNVGAKEVCIIADSPWCRKVMDTAYEIGVLGGVVESNISNYMLFLKRYPGVTVYSHIEKAIEEGFNNYVVDISDKNKFEIVRCLLSSEKNVLIKKIITSDCQDISDLIEISRSAKSRIMLGNTLEFYEIIEKVKEIVSKRQIGVIEEVFSCRYNDPISDENSNSLLSTKEESVIISQLSKLNVEILDKICLSKNSEMEDEIANRYANKLIERNYISLQTTNYCSFKMLIFGSDGLIVVENINRSYTLTLYCNKYNLIAYKASQLRKRTKNINCFLKEELQAFLNISVHTAISLSSLSI